MLDRPRLRDRAAGRWHGIFIDLGVPANFLTGKHGPCPFCGGKDRFRWSNQNQDGTSICSQCGPRSAMGFLQNFKKWDYPTTVTEVEKVIGAARETSHKSPITDAKRRKMLNELWMSARPVQLDDPVGRYLNRRCGLTVFPKCLRFAPNLTYYDERPSKHPAMVAMLTDIEGRPVTLHRTYLTTDGFKANVPAVRRMMPGKIEGKGVSVRLSEPHQCAGISEGIETALSAQILSSGSVWAAINTALLQQWEPPQGSTRVIIFGDNDAPDHYAGQAAAYTLAKKLASRFKVEVRIPPEPGQDWNDVHQKNCRLGRSK